MQRSSRPSTQCWAGTTRPGSGRTPRGSRSWPAGFEGLAYEVFEIELVREAEPRLLGMLREGTLPGWP
jgi:hypothetical protein